MGEDRDVDLRFDGLLLAPRGAPDWPRQQFPTGQAARQAAGSRLRSGRPPEAIRLLGLIALIGTLVATGWWANDDAPLPPGLREFFLAVLALSLAWLMLSPLMRQRRTVAELRAREEQLIAQSAL